MPLESKSSFIRRINSTMAIVFGPSKMTKSRATLTFLTALTAIALYFCYLLVVPFLKPIIFSSILTIIFYPVQVRIHRVIRNRHISALLSTAVVILLITLLSFFLGRAIVSGLGEIYQSLRGSGEGRERLSLFILQFIDRAIAWTSGYAPISAPDLQKALLAQVEKAVARLVVITAGAFHRPCFLGTGRLIPGHLGSGHDAVCSAAHSRNDLRLVAGDVHAHSQRSLGKKFDSSNLAYSLYILWTMS